MKKRKKTIALVAHDNRKPDMVEWVSYNWKALSSHRLICTGTTGSLVEKSLQEKCESAGMVPPDVVRLKSGPLGGDQQLGARISDKKFDMRILVWDPMYSQPYDVDVKAFLRISALYNVPTATNRATADFMISSDLFHSDYKPVIKDYSGYIKRELDL